MIPYIYSLSIESHLYGTPIIRPLVYQFQHDSKLDQQSFEFMLGPSLLVASVVDQDSLEKVLYLPAISLSSSGYWCDIWTGKWYSGGQTIKVEVPLSQHGAVFAPHGAMVPTGALMKYVGEIPDSTRVIWLFPPPEIEYKSEFLLHEDDGESFNAPLTKLKITMYSNASLVQVKAEIIENGYELPYRVISFSLPKGDPRFVPDPIYL